MLMLVHVVPNACHLNETLYNLNFAQRVRSAGGTQNSGGYSDDVVDSVEAAAAEVRNFTTQLEYNQ